MDLCSWPPSPPSPLSARNASRPCRFDTASGAAGAAPSCRRFLRSWIPAPAHAGLSLPCKQPPSLYFFGLEPGLEPVVLNLTCPQLLVRPGHIPRTVILLRRLRLPLPSLCSASPPCNSRLGGPASQSREHMLLMPSLVGLSWRPPRSVSGVLRRVCHEAGAQQHRGCLIITADEQELGLDDEYSALVMCDVATGFKYAYPFAKRNTDAHLAWRTGGCRRHHCPLLSPQIPLCLASNSWPRRTTSIGRPRPLCPRASLLLKIRQGPAWRSLTAKSQTRQRG